MRHPRRTAIAHGLLGDTPETHDTDQTHRAASAWRSASRRSSPIMTTQMMRLVLEIYRPPDRVGAAGR